MAFYWVNKSERYKTKDGRWEKAPQGMLGNYLWAPLKNKNGGPPQYHWTVLNEIKPGDHIFVSVHSTITAIAVAKESAVITPAPIDFVSWSGEGFKVVVDYKPLEQKIPVSTFYDDIKNILPKKYGPLNVKGRPKEGYCFFLGDEAGEFLKNLILSNQEINKISGLFDLSQAPINDDDPYAPPQNMEDARKEIIRAIKQRQGQQKFRNDLLEIYGNRCAISGSKALAVLEAAHIVPYKGEETNHLSNGLILRADIHTLFDRNLIKISPKDYSISIDAILHNTEYEQYSGLRLRMPKKNVPSREALEFKNKENSFR